MQRLPKLRGFNSHKTPIEVVYTGQLNALKSKTADNKVLAEAGFVSSEYVAVKLLVNGELTKAVSVKLQAASSNAVETVVKAGGTFDKTPRVPRPATRKKEDKKEKK